MTIRYDFETDFEFIVDDREVREFLINQIAQDCYDKKSKRKEQDEETFNIIKDTVKFTLNLLDIDGMEDIYYQYQDEIKDYFEDEARKQYEESCGYETQCKVIDTIIAYVGNR